MEEKIPREPKTPEEIVQRMRCAIAHGGCSLHFVRIRLPNRKGQHISHECKHCGFIDREWNTRYPA